MEIEGIDRLVIGVKDMDRALGFYKSAIPSLVQTHSG